MTGTVAYVLLNGKVKAVEQQLASLPRGINFKGAVDYVNSLPTNAELGDTYTVKYHGTSGNVPYGAEFAWGEYDGTQQWIKLSSGEVGGGKIEMLYNGTNITVDGAIVNFKQIVDYLTVDNKFTYLLYNNMAYLTTKIDTTSSLKQVVFESSHVDGGMGKIFTITVNSSDGVTIASINHTHVANENYSNKVSTIAENDKKSTVHYPSNKAVTDITDELKEDLFQLISSRTDGEIQNGKYLGASTTGEQYQDKLVENSNSLYSVVDFSSHIGDYVCIEVDFLTDGTSRCIAFCDETGKIQKIYTEHELYSKYTQVGERYLLEMKIEYPIFVFSCRKASGGIINNVVLYSGTSSRSYTKSETDALITKTTNKIRYVSPNGNDKNDGLTQDTAFATMNKAISDGATIIKLLRGIYIDKINIRNSSITIIGDDAIFENVLGTAFSFYYSDVTISGVTVRNPLPTTSSSSISGFMFRGCNVNLIDCKAINALNMGFKMDGCKATLNRCYAVGAAVDGFNGHDVDDSSNPDNPIHYTTKCTLIDCVAKNCGDDGLSLHEDGEMYVIGGEYSNNASTGIAPHQRCKAEIRNAYIHDNEHSGIECFNPTYQEGEESYMNTYNNLIESNGQYAINAQYYTVKSIKDTFVNNTLGNTNEREGATIAVY